MPRGKFQRPRRAAPNSNLELWGRFDRDLQYIEQFWLDLKIIVRTVVHAFTRGSGD